MSSTEQDTELDEAIADAELTDEEAAKVRHLVADGGIIPAVIEYVIGERESADEEPAPDKTPPAPPAATFVVDDKKVEKEIERHLEHMSELLGPTADDYVPCDECGGAGITAAGPKMKPHEMYRACPTCDGYGKVLTGSKDPQFAAQGCPDCAGRGFQTKTPIAGEPAPIAGAVIERGEGYGTEAWMGDTSLQAKPVEAGWS